ncbi:hypothetical protein OB919_00035 [Halobacteria archaeon AArc-curdl1]|uniref:Uncharacterized protein n=1 Tax=Natronosalvus hydrolyticus TaxID=2979988 RepID=A0AAP2Z568_9EURY|nr:hypothetical protein [Halobacteria archaeon AArc-curdl1]
MSQTRSAQDSPLENPMVRHGVGIGGAALLVFIAVFFLEGMLMYIVLGIAVLDAIVTPKILEMAVEGDES